MQERRVEVGFEGGTVLRLTVDQAAADALIAALRSDGDGWCSVDAEEGTYWINPDELCYVRLVPGELPKIGFGGN